MKGGLYLGNISKKSIDRSNLSDFTVILKTIGWKAMTRTINRSMASILAAIMEMAGRAF